MKTTNYFKSLTGMMLLLSCISVHSCEKDENDSVESKQIQTQFNAESASFYISMAFKDNCPTYSTDWSYSNKVEYGHNGGTAKITGSYYVTQSGTAWSGTEHHTLNNVKVVFENYRNDEDSPLISGTGYFKGTLTCDHSTVGNDYSGSWTITGNFKLTGRFEDEVSIYLSYYNDLDYIGSLTVRGITYQVSSY